MGMGCPAAPRTANDFDLAAANFFAWLMLDPPSLEVHARAYGMLRTMSICVTGGAGYIGSHMVRALRRAGHDVVVIDDLSAGHEDTIPRGVTFVRADVRDRDVVTRALKDHAVSAVFHFASRIQVGESVVNPRLYYRDNLAAAIALLDSALDAKVARFVLSSTAAVYGDPVRTPIDEDHPTSPVNPYGVTMLFLEKMLASYGGAYGLAWSALRYFNASGADLDEGLGERHDPETHLIPIVLEAALGKRPHVAIFGDDYATPDGTCVRDYVHVNDIADAHLAALAHLERGGASGAFNLGTGRGHSVREVIETARKVSGRAIPIAIGARREGDPPVLVASADRAERVLGWRAKRGDLEGIVRDAWTFHASR
jgi:UDP-glucose 4-epimerase